MKTNPSSTTTNRPGKPSGSLDWREWFFDRLDTPSEKIVCCFWEYARESAFIRDTAARLQELVEIPGDGIGKLNEDLQLIQGIGQPMPMVFDIADPAKAAERPRVLTQSFSARAHLHFSTATSRTGKPVYRDLRPLPGRAREP